MTTFRGFRLFAVTVLLVFLASCGSPSNDAGQDPQDTWHVLPPGGGSFTSLEGYGLGATLNAIGNSLSVSIGAVDGPEVPLPEWLKPVGDYFEFKAAETTYAGDEGLFVIRAPVPPGAPTGNLGLAILLPPGYATDLDVATWSLLEGHEVSGGEAFMAGTLLLVEEGAVAVLVSSPGLDSNPPGLHFTLEPELARQAIYPWPTVDFYVKCVGYDDGCPSIAEEIRQTIEKAAVELSAAGFKNPRVTRRYELWDWKPSDGVPSFAMGPYVVHLEPLRLDDAGEADCGSMGRRGGYYLGTGTIGLCQGGAHSFEVDYLRGTAYHELFHAVQAAYHPAVGKWDTWISEGQATLVNARATSDSLARFKGYPPREIDVSLLQVKGGAYGASEYLTQDFWLYLLGDRGGDLAALLPYVEVGQQTRLVDAAIARSHDAFSGLGAAYWYWAKNQVFEKTFDIGEQALGAACQLGAPFNGGSFYVATPRTVIYEAGKAFELSLPPLTSNLIEIDLTKASIADAAALISVKPGSDLRWKFYEHAEAETTACRQTPDGGEYVVNPQAAETAATVYLLVSNVSISETLNSRVAFAITPIDTRPPLAFTLQPGQLYCTEALQPAIRLTWSASAGAEAYEIHRDGSLYYSLEALGTTFENTTNITPGQTYSYFVRARNSQGVTDSNTQTVKAEVEGCQVGPVAGADLIITDLTVTPDSAEPGSVVAVTFNITNQGDTPSAATVTRIRINTGAAVVMTSDPLLAEIDTPPVPAMESLSYSHNVTLPSDLAEGNHLLWVIADVFNQGEQSNYDNDRATTALWVGAPLIACASGDPNNASDPCELTTIEQLQAVSTNLAGHYVLGGNINATATATWNDGSGFEPIGSHDHPFTGTLDGRGFEIVGLTINRTDTELVGLFGVVGSAGLVRDINLVGGAVSGLESVGAVAGLSHGTLQEIQQSSSVHGQDRVGGLVGVNAGLISGAMTLGAVEGSSLIGGIVGHNLAGGIVAEAYNAGVIQGEAYVGGVVGLSEGGSIIEASNNADVTGENTVGGILGLGEEGVTLVEVRNTAAVNGVDYTGGIAGLYGGTITTSSNSGSVTGNDYVGGLSGLGGVGPISDSNNSGSVSGREYVGGITGLSGAGPINTSFNAGTVIGETYVGGVAGLSQGNIENSYNIGRVEGTSEVGGITSILSGESTIGHVFSAGAVVAVEYASAIVSIYTAPNRLVGAHFDTITTGRPESDVGNGWATPQMFQPETFAGWDFQAVWGLQEGADYPDLITNPR